MSTILLCYPKPKTAQPMTSRIRAHHCEDAEIADAVESYIREHHHAAPVHRLKAEHLIYDAGGPCLVEGIQTHPTIPLGIRPQFATFLHPILTEILGGSDRYHKRYGDFQAVRIANLYGILVFRPETIEALHPWVQMLTEWDRARWDCTIVAGTPPERLWPPVDE